MGARIRVLQDKGCWTQGIVTSAGAGPNSTFSVVEDNRGITQYALNKHTFCIEGSAEFFSMGSDVSKSPATLQKRRAHTEFTDELLGEFQLGDYVEILGEFNRHIREIDGAQTIRGTVVCFDDWDMNVRLDPPHFEFGKGEVRDAKCV